MANKTIYGYHDYNFDCETPFEIKGNKNKICYGIELEIEFNNLNVDYDDDCFEPEWDEYLWYNEEEDQDHCNQCDEPACDCTCGNCDEYFEQLDRYNNQSRYCDGEIDIHDPDNMFYVATDGSLRNGLEFISQPATIGYWLNKRQTITKFLQSLDDYEPNDEINTNGYHIHITRKYFNETTERRLVYIFEKFKSELSTFSRRTTRNIRDWTNFIDRSNTPTTLDWIMRTNKIYDGTRSRAVNLTNKNTIEIRLFKGTNNPLYVYATLKLVDRIVNLALTKGNDLETLTWDNLTDDKEIREYLRAINYEQRVKDLQKIETITQAYNLLVNSSHLLEMKTYNHGFNLNTTSESIKNRLAQDYLYNIKSYFSELINQSIRAEQFNSELINYLYDKLNDTINDYTTDGLIEKTNGLKYQLLLQELVKEIN